MPSIVEARPSRHVSATPPAPCVADIGTEPAVEFSHVSLAFDDRIVLRDISFCIPRGATRFLLGASGAGKSVVLKLILGLLRPDTGTIRVNGRQVEAMTEHELLRLRADIGMVFQENALFDSLTVAENVGYPLAEEGLAPVVVRSRVAEVLASLELSGLADRLPAQLSGGQRRRVAIARAMAPNPTLLLFDDPITGLDPLIATAIDKEILKLRDLHQVTAIVVTHQMRDAFYIATHEAVRDDGGIRFVEASAAKAAQIEFMVLLDGRIHFQGSAAALLASPDPYLKRYMLQTLPPW